MTDLSIIIVNYNDQRFLKDCLSSVYNETPHIKFEIIFVDNNSSDNSVALVRQEFPKVKIIQNKENLGFCKANNQGLKIFQGRHALLLNTDTIVKSRALEKMVGFMDANPNVGVCGPRLLNPDGTPQHQGGLFNRRFWLSKKSIKVDYMLGACLMVRREIVNKVGGLDENFFFSNDDLDWCRRITKAGWGVYFLPQAEVIHYGGFTTKRFNQRIFVEGFRGGLYFSKKHYGSFIYYAYRFLLAFSMLIAIFFTALFYPLLKNKQKLAAFVQILGISIKGEIYPSYGKDKNILLVSNGHAEDLTAAAIGANIRKALPDIEMRALPMVGLGKAYHQKGIENLGLKKVLPSGGFAKEGLRYFFKDLGSGLLGSLFRQIMILRNESKRTQLVVCMGDVFLAALCGIFVGKPIIYIDGPNSIRIREYYPIEKWILKKFCKKVFVQDEATAEFLRRSDIPGLYAGTWVMDYVNLTGEDFGIDKHKIPIGILPGTREEAYHNLLLILKVIDSMAKTAQENEKPIGLVAFALDRARLKQKLSSTQWNYQETDPKEKGKGITAKIVAPSNTTVLIAEGKFGDVCKSSKLIIGMAGIANEQAVGLGTPVVAFPGRGPQTTLRRWKEIHHITGDSMAILSGKAEEIARKTWEILRDPVRLKEMSRTGLESKKDQGGIRRISDLIIKTLQKG